jgi:hypothetical protein
MNLLLMWPIEDSKVSALTTPLLPTALQLLVLSRAAEDILPPRIYLEQTVICALAPNSSSLLFVLARILYKWACVTVILSIKASNDP